MLDADTILNDRYRLHEPIGEGGMATVYRAVDTRLGRTVAIKVLQPHFGRDEPFLRRFQQEAEFAASLGAHPNIVDIYDIGQDGDLHYIVMELVEGRSLKELIRERAPFSVNEAFAIGQQVASALDFAHKRGLVHRDVKPQNILVTPEGVAKVTDFGIARSISASQLTRTGMVIGTVHYFSPEQAQGKPAGPASDIYSLGIILYEMLTGHLPFDAENAIGVAMQHLHSEPPSPWEYNPEIPALTVATIMRALEKDPERRYRDAGELASALGSPEPADTGATTMFNPIATTPPRQQTAVYQTVEPAPPRRKYVVEEPVARPDAAVARPLPANRWRTAWLALGGALLAVAVAFAAFFATNHFLGSSTAPTATPTSTPTPTPKPTPRPPQPTATATVSLPVVVQPTATPVPLPPTFTPTPVPLPTNTPTLVPPTPTPPPPTPTPPPPTPTPSPLPLPAAVTATAVG